MPQLHSTEQSLKATGAPVASVAAWLCVWQFASWCMGQPIILPGPIEVLRACVALVPSAAFWTTVCSSALRIMGGLLASYVLALPAAVLAYRFPVVRTLLNPPLQVIKAAPIACLVVLLLLWLGSANVSFAAVLLMALPNLYFTSLEGLAHQDSHMVELFDAHAVHGARRALALTWQQLLSYVCAASANVVGMAWKAGVAAELIGVPLGSIGERVYQSKLLLETADVLAWTLTIIVLSMLCEHMVLFLLRASGPAAVSLALRLREPAEVLDEARGEAQGESRLTAGVELRDVPVPFPTLEQNINLTVAPGGRVCLTSPSGSGKTTTLRLVAGLLKPASGEVCAPPRCSMMFQESCLIEHASALQNVLLFAPRNVEANEVEALLADLIPDIDANAPVNELSGGQRRRVELVRTMLIPGDVVLLDEPFTGLDAAAYDCAIAFVLERLQGRTLIVATHDPRDLALQSSFDSSAR